MVGIRMSDITTCGRCSRTAARPSAPSCASMVWCPSCSRSVASALRFEALSSMMSIFAIGLVVEQLDVAGVVLAVDGAHVVLLMAGEALSLDRLQSLYPGAAACRLVGHGAGVHI